MNWTAQYITVLALIAWVIAYSLVGMTGALDRPGTEDGCVVVAELCEEAP
jgi:hypothetical protein